MVEVTTNIETNFTSANTLRVNVRKLQVLQPPLTWYVHFSMSRDWLAQAFTLKKFEMKWRKIVQRLKS